MKRRRKRKMKPIKIDAGLRQKMIEEFQNYITDTKFTSTDINFKRDFSKLLGVSDLPKPVLLFTTVAWVKMQALVQGTNTEIGWHGLVTRMKDNVFIITDIVLYPQIIASTTVTTDTDAYGKWCCDLTPEECNHMRFQGHSHPSFSTSPSGVDLAYYESILSTLRNDEFYIFVIMNKKGEMSVLLYDLATNAIYETKDVLYTIVDNKHRSIHRWAEEQMKAFCTERPIPAASTPAATNVNRFDSRNLIWAYNSLGNQIQMEERYVEHCLECGTPNAKVRETCARCGAKVYSTLK